MLPAASIADVWKRLDEGRIVFVARKGGEYLCEGPYERLDLMAADRPLADEDTESCIRLFFSRDECEEYCATWRELLGVGPENKQVDVMAVTLSDVWKNLGSIVANSYADYQQPPRIDLCTTFGGGSPVPIDTQFSELEELN